MPEYIYSKEHRPTTMDTNRSNNNFSGFTRKMFQLIYILIKQVACSCSCYRFLLNPQNWMRLFHGVVKAQPKMNRGSIDLNSSGLVCMSLYDNKNFRPSFSICWAISFAKNCLTFVFEIAMSRNFQHLACKVSDFDSSVYILAPLRKLLPSMRNVKNINKTRSLFS